MRINEILSMNAKDLHNYLFYELRYDELNQEILLAAITSLAKQNMILQKKIEEVNSYLERE